ncbi:hypothetical protein E3983_03270 [Legionella israelensis]|uniref:Transmembrane protein n=1 Tax=Legionella israelensis TaxID=454 RepID=A0AAX1EF60_9GAMM|nr:DUF6789 family protein [Legionella israelensis]QBR83469.1 hypothetical protein E3983_03270 [Legionella israelensis]
MNKYLAGFIAGFVATVVLSVLMMLKEQMGLMPQFNVIQDFNQFFGTENVLVGWILHFGLGTFIWGGIFVILVPALKGSYWLRGIYFGIIAWFLMMIGYMPVMAHGFFGMNLGLQVIIATLVLHIIYGFVLGLTYGAFPKKIEVTKY